MTTTTPTLTIVRSDERYCADHGWLKTCYSFSFADYQDPNNLNWGALRVLNDDRIAGGEGFPPHPHRDMEIITYVLSGDLEHQDSMGNRGVVGPGGVQYMSAGTGVRHAEYNHSKTEELHLVQMWVLPPKTGLPAQYGQREFGVNDRLGRLFLVASGKPGATASISLQQKAAFLVSRLEDGEAGYSFEGPRLGFLFIAEGEIVANGESLRTGDAVRMAGIPALEVKGKGELLLWDVPEAGS
ncbi:MAG: pirin family protein [Candidatus Eremiobacteraeota bacterium]|nr:pirin family protein [Candidatus Eremiobacteraeota bacterium]